MILVSNPTSRAQTLQGARAANTFTSRGTGYFPDPSPMEGGYFDRRGKPLKTLQAYLRGAAPYVSVAMDTAAFPYGTRLRIVELERKYGRQIEFRVVDTGGRFEGRRTAKIDICVENERASVDSTINGPLHCIVQGAGGAGRDIGREAPANSSTLRRGSTGRAVNAAQRKLGVRVTGTYDAATEAAVRKFQRDNGLEVDGWIGRGTAQALGIGLDE